jgi:hypothetical protein
VLPDDAKLLCTFEAGEFAGWFETGAVTLDGAVKPKDSLNFSADAPSDLRICNFHKWSEQMFLWLTSPAAGGGRAFQSPDFYRVSGPRAGGVRTLARNLPSNTGPDSEPFEQGGQPEERYVLMAGNGSLVYYATHVNELYAYFLTGTKNGGITPQPTRFPIKKPEVEQIIAFGKDRGMTITDIDDPKARAMVVQVKSAWVETTRLDASKYITMTAKIPNYTPDSSNTRLTRAAEPKEVQLALVGMHVVGSAKNHREMIWATFEHIDNAPMKSFSYKTSNEDDRIHPTPVGTWLFSAGNCTGSFNVGRMHARNRPNIDAVLGNTIGPSDTCRENAWGVSPDDAERNTQIVAINRNVIGMLPTGDVRKNYLLIGTIWGQGVGSNLLANTALETYEQHDKNCFNCHRGTLHGGELSRMFARLKPLFP